MGWSRPLADGFAAFTKQVEERPEVSVVATAAISVLTFLPWQSGRIIGATTLFFSAYHIIDHTIGQQRWGKECEAVCGPKGGADRQAKAALNVHLRYGLVGSFVGLFSALAARMPLPRALPKISAGRLSAWMGLAGAACMTVGQVRAGRVDSSSYIVDGYHKERHLRQRQGAAVFMLVLLATPLLILAIRGLRVLRRS